MRRVPLGYVLVGAASVCSCAAPTSDLARATETRTETTESLASASQALLEASVTSRTDVVAVMASRGIDEQLCTGTLLLPNLVLTARHCLITDRSAINSGDCATAVIAEPDPQTSVVVVPGTDVDLVPDDAKTKVSQYLLPSDEGRLCGQDIALLLLSNPIDVVPLSIISTPPAASSAFTVVGYGLFDGDWGQQRQSNDATLICVGTACSDTRLVEGELLARAGACDGDSGGPALDTNGQQFGLLSRSTADCSESAYLELGSYFDWLKTGVEYAASQGSYDVPTWALGTPQEADAGISLPAVQPDMRARGGCSMSGGLNRNGAVSLFALAALMLLRRRSNLPG